MTEKHRPDGPAASGKGQASAEARRRRKAALLRENLMKRKAQTRQRGSDDGVVGSDGRESEK